MSWGCGAGNTRSTTLAAEAEAAAAGTQIDNQILIDMLMGRMTVGVNPSPTAADGTWPDEEHVALARHAIEHPFLVVPHPKNADHPLCVKCGIFAASTLVVLAPGSIPEWPACKGMFPNTHCRSRQVADAEFRGIAIGSSAINASKQKMSRETVSQRDAEIRDMAKWFTANLAVI